MRSALLVLAVILCVAIPTARAQTPAPAGSLVVTVVDSTGAGDQYAAGFMLALARGKPLDHCARLGGLAAAEVISHYGPRPQVSLAELAAANGLS